MKYKKNIKLHANGLDICAINPLRVYYNLSTAKRSSANSKKYVRFCKKIIAFAFGDLNLPCYVNHS